MNACEWSARIAELARREQSALADLLLAVAEFDGQALYRQLGFSSLFDFLHREVGLSRGSAYYRQVGARLVRRFPEVEGPIRDGRLCITTVSELAKVMTEENYSHLMLIPMPGKNKAGKYDFLHERALDAPYRFSTQAGLWKTERFKYYLRPHESPWMAEIWGSKRTARTPDSFYSINPDYIKTHGYIIDYFIKSAFPTRDEVRKLLEALEATPHGLSVPEMLIKVNISKGRVEKTVALLSLESPAPIAKQGSKWQLTAS
ncbi:MAG: hypothetical protein WCK73_18090, partial [Deltaproteobacteria bacterium]